MQNRRLNQKGVTLVEVMIALVIMLVVFMGLIQASILSINSNLRNEIRDEAVRIASEYMSRAKSTPIDTLTTTVCPTLTTTTATVNRGFRNLTQPYTVKTEGCFVDTTKNDAQVTVTVTYTSPGDTVSSKQGANSIVKR